VAIEVAERRRLDETRARFAAIVDSSDDAIIGKTLDGQITSWNASAERIFGFSPEETIGQPINIIIPARWQREEADVLARLRHGQAVRPFETVRVRKDGQLIDVSLTVSPIRADAGRIIGASNIVRDITEQKRVRQEREEFLRSEQAAHTRAEKTLLMLRRLQIVTDTALSKLTQEELLPELLARLRSALNADTATVLLLEPDGQHLTPVRSAGIPEHTDDGVRIPLGRGAAGRIATSDAGLIFNDLTKVEIYSPRLRERVTSLVGAPLKIAERVIGVIHVGSGTPREFTDDDLDLIRLVAHRAALAIERTQLHAAERAARRWRKLRTVSRMSSWR
jgi:PAS domain S-box-containing protein